ncbi:MAG: hypothetical protein IJU66_06825 [Oscillospiraceae bacterium]|nr:hypothetical protein [Oscillospiraceae bacterium]
MAKSKRTRSVLFYKRVIGVTLIVVILGLAVACGVLGARLGRTDEALAQAQGELDRRNLEEAEKRAAEEAERLRNAIPPERVKPAGERSAQEILDECPAIVHALGAIDGVSGLNCLEGFLMHYNSGARVFEVDIRLTADGKPVLRHDWIGGLQDGVDTTSIPTLDEFRSKPILDKYTPLSFRDLLLLMAEYPDICIITDTKFTDAETVTMQFNAMLDDAHALGMSYLFDRMIVQVYSPDHFTVVDGLHHFPFYIYTLYQDYFGRTEDSFRNKCVFCQENGIMGLTLNAELWDADFLPISNWRSINVYLHTINDADEGRRLLRTGVRAVYSDTLDPADLME